MQNKDHIHVADVMTQNVITVSEDDTVLSATLVMSEHNISSIIVLQNGSVSGIVTEDDILESVVELNKNLEDTLIKDVMVTDIISTTSQTPVSRAGRVIRDKAFEILPVIDDDKLVGVLSRTDITGALGSLGYFRVVSDAMTKDVISVTTKDYVKDAVDLMAKNQISSVLVMNGDVIVGIFTEKDLIQKVVSKAGDHSKIGITEVMTFPVITVEPETTITEANRIQTEMKLRELPVIDNGKLVGILSETNVLGIVEQIELEYEGLKYIGNMAMKDAASSLSEMLDMKLDIEIPEIEFVPVEHVTDMLGSKASLVAGVFLDVSGDISGSVLLMCPAKTACLLVDILSGKDAGTTETIDEDGMIILKKIYDVLTKSYIDVLSAQLNLDITYSESHSAFDVAGAVIDLVLIRHSQVADYVTANTCTISSEDIEGYLFFLFDPESLDLMTKRVDTSWVDR